MNEFARFSKRAVDYIFDRPARNDDASPIWCLGLSYDSDHHPSNRPPSSSATANLPGTSPSAHSDVSHADSAVVTKAPTQAEEQADNDDELVKSFDQVHLTKSMDEEDLGWPSAFLDDFESRVWITYRDNFPPIPKSSDPAAASKMSFTTKLRSFTNQNGFTSDTGWGCMIRSGQSLLANTIILLHLGREWRKGQRESDHKDILSLFADTPEAPFSIHKFVEHGAHACGTYPGEWFGPNATARCLRSAKSKLCCDIAVF
jgi:cysteine protease ATG4